jgi:hypothetical protein
LLRHHNGSLDEDKLSFNKGDCLVRVFWQLVDGVGEAFEGVEAGHGPHKFEEGLLEQLVNEFDLGDEVVALDEVDELE